MTPTLKKTTLLLASLGAGMALCLPAGAEPPPWAPAHGHRAKMEREREAREYRYTYYPAQQVYYAPETHTWFWLNGGTWQVGVNLPGSIRINAGSTGGVPVTLATSRPYTQHVYVEERYGRPWRERHGRGPDRDHGRHHERDRGHDRDHGHGHGNEHGNGRGNGHGRHD